MRQVVLDTETTGLSPEQGHRITEIGCVEILDRKTTGQTFQTYLNPEREIDEEAERITGLTYDFLKDKPKFADVANDFLSFIEGAEIIIHNAPFDLGFLNHELQRMKHPISRVEQISTILDTLVMAKGMHPGQRNSLDALCKRYSVDNTHRDYHGALLDSEILASVYLAMTAGQTSFKLTGAESSEHNGVSQMNNKRLVGGERELKVIRANVAESIEHKSMLEMISKASGDNCLWSKD